MRKITERIGVDESTSQKAATTFPTSAPFQVLNNNIVSLAQNRQEFLDKGFNQNDTVFALTQLISEKIKAASWAPYKVVDDLALKRYHEMVTKASYEPINLQKASELRAKALEPFENDQRLNELLEFPNEFDTFPDIVANSSINKLMLGNRMLKAEILEVGANQGKPFSLHILPSQMVTLIVSRTWPFRILAYRIYAWGELTFTTEEVLIDRYYNPNIDLNGSHLYGFSPMQPAEAVVDRSNSENTASTMAFHNGGPRTIIFVDEPTFAPEQKAAQASAIKKVLTSAEYTGAFNSNKLASSPYKMGAVPVGLSPVDLGIAESEVNTLRRLCNVIGQVPSQLMNDAANKTYNSLVEAEKSLTTRAALPLMNSFRNQFNRKLGTDWGYKGQRVYVDYDVTVYTELQENMKDKWSWVERLPVPNGYKLDLMGLDHPEGQDEFMDQILVPSGFELSTSYGENDTDRALEEGDGEIS